MTKNSKVKVKVRYEPKSKAKDEIDESLYSRQIYTLGKEAMGRITKSKVLISGLSGLGVEIAKCVILGGVKQVTLHDSTNLVTWRDLSSNYYLKEEDVGSSLLDKITPNLASLNPNVVVNSTSKGLTTNLIKQFDVIVFCDQNIFDLIYWNKVCRTNGVKFITCGSYGLFGYSFCDFGDRFISLDPDGDQEIHAVIVKSQDNLLQTDEPHDLHTGDVIEIDGQINGIDLIDENNNKTKFLVEITSTHEFKLKMFVYNEDESHHDQLQAQAFRAEQYKIPDQVLTNTEFRQVKTPVLMTFKSLEESMANPEFVITDMINWDRPQTLHMFMQALHIFTQHKHQKSDIKSRINNNDVNAIWDELPRSYNEDDYRTIQNIINNINTGNANLENDIIKKLSFTSAGKLCPIDSVIGSVTAQEVLKGCSNKFTPNRQWFYFDAFSVLPEDQPIDTNPKNSRYDGQIAVFGSDYQKKLQDGKIFIVGSGAIGCEHIKNFSMMGIENMIITDMDYIEKSNLNRQFLFRSTDIGKAKSVTAAEKAILMNPNVKVIAQENKVGTETLDIYNSEFFDNLTCVANALDNVKARLFVDSLCVQHKRPLLESGTLGTKGNIQSIIPHITESYGSTEDPPEKSIPVCTLKLFPYNYDHVVQFSRDQFEGFFNRIPSNFVKVRDNFDSVKSMTPTEVNEIYQDLQVLLHNHMNFKNCINLAYHQWHKLYRDQITALLRKFPADHKDKEGNNFWSGTKRLPKSFNFDVNNNLHLDFVISMSQIWADILGIPEKKRYASQKREKYITFLNRLNPPEESNIEDLGNQVDEEGNEKQKKNNNNNNNLELDVDQMLENIQKTFDLIKSNLNSKSDGTEISPMEFEKDDDSNHHIDFITAAANLRALNYQIPVQDRLATKGIAGKIIPAIATTTSLVSGLVGLEMYKVFYGYDDISRYRCGFLNLGVTFFGFTEPSPAKGIKINNKNYNMWTVDEIDADMTLEELIDTYDESYFEKRNGQETKKVDLEVGYISYGSCIIHNSMMPGQSNLKLKKKLRDLVQESTPGIKKAFFTISLEQEDESDEDLENENEFDTTITCSINM